MGKLISLAIVTSVSLFIVFYFLFLTGISSLLLVTHAQYVKQNYQSNKALLSAYLANETDNKDIEDARTILASIDVNEAEKNAGITDEDLKAIIEKMSHASQKALAYYIPLLRSDDNSLEQYNEIVFESSQILRMHNFYTMTGITPDMKKCMDDIHKDYRQKGKSVNLYDSGIELYLTITRNYPDLLDG